MLQNLKGEIIMHELKHFENQTLSDLTTIVT